MLYLLFTMKNANAQNKSEIVAALPLACSSEDEAVSFLEQQRWNGQPVCPHCGVVNESRQIVGKNGERGPRYLWRCLACKKQFTIRVGTIFSESKIPLRFWVLAFWRANSSKKGVSSLQIQRETGLSYKSALFMMHRIRFAMTANVGSERMLSGVVEADESYIGGKPRRKQYPAKRRVSMDSNEMVSRRGPAPDFKDRKIPVVAVLERGGEVRASVMTNVTAANIKDMLLATTDTSARLMTDESPLYTKVGRPFADHQTTKHSAYEYVRGEVHSNGVESFFARLKRQMYGTHHAVSAKHLHRYVAEVVYKHNTREMEDGERTVAAIQAGQGKRLRRQ